MSSIFVQGSLKRTVTRLVSAVLTHTLSIVGELTSAVTVELTAAALAQLEPKGGIDEQAIALRDAMRLLFPEAVALVSAARQGFMRES